jgi:hydrogenase-1 operon protein HyaF
MDELNCPAAAAAWPDPARAVVDAVMREVATLLAALVRDPQFADAIDLYSLPLNERERQRLRDELGHGEISVALDLAGPTHIEETAFAGVWWLRHDGSDGRALLEQIVVARVPALLCAQPDDIADAAQRLAAEPDTRPGDAP